MLEDNVTGEKSSHPGARNPKTRAFSIKVTEDINTRVENLADAAGMNKSTMAAILVAAGLRQMEAIFLLQQQQRQIVSQYVDESAQGQLDDMLSVAPPGFIK
jgi:predicted transcriptional regulator